MRNLRWIGARLSLVVLSGLLVVGLSSVAGARGLLGLAFTVSEHVALAMDELECVVPEEGTEAPTDPGEEGSVEPGTEEGSEGEEPVEEPLCEEPPEELEGEGDPGEEDVEPSEQEVLTLEEREAECMTAAGLAENPLPEGEKLTGLDNAISRVLENCKKNPQAPGLVNALERLAENRAKKQDHEEAKAERAAEREARKAAKEEAKAARMEEKAAKGAQSSQGGGQGQGHGRSSGGSSSGGSGKGKGKG